MTLKSQFEPWKEVSFKELVQKNANFFSDCKPGVNLIKNQYLPNLFLQVTQLTLTCSKSAKEILDVKYVQS